MDSRVREAMRRADELAEKQLKVDQQALAQDAAEAGGGGAASSG